MSSTGRVVAEVYDLKVLGVGRADHNYIAEVVGRRQPFAVSHGQCWQDDLAHPASLTARAPRVATISKSDSGPESCRLDLVAGVDEQPCGRGLGEPALTMPIHIVTRIWTATPVAGRYAPNRIQSAWRCCDW